MISNQNTQGKKCELEPKQTIVSSIFQLALYRLCSGTSRASISA